MLVNFSIKNFRSFWELNTLSFEPILKKQNKPLSFCAIYGPNASGKSNILKALQYVRNAMTNTDAVNKLTVSHQFLQPFLLSKKGSKEPSFFELTLFDKSKHTFYRYGFEVDNQRVVSEWLIETAKRVKKVTDRELFVRTLDSIKFDNSVPKNIKKLKSNVPKTILALPFFANNNYKAALVVTDLVKNKFILFDSSDPVAFTEFAWKRLIEDDNLRNNVIKFIKTHDFGIQDLRIDKVLLPDDLIKNLPIPFKPINNQGKMVGRSVRTMHNIYNSKGANSGFIEFDFISQESLGTQKFVPFVTLALDAIQQGLVVVVDEFGSSFHPFITSSIVKLFSKQKNAQLIALTNETYLLSRDIGLDRDQVWFVEKNRYEQSNLTCLAEYKPREEARIFKQYLEGRFGAVPVIFD